MESFWTCSWDAGSDSLVLESELPADALPFRFAERLAPAVRGHKIRGTQRDAGEPLYWGCSHELVQQIDHQGQQPVEQDAGFGVQPSPKEFLQAPGLAAAKTVSRC